MWSLQIDVCNCYLDSIFNTHKINKGLKLQESCPGNDSEYYTVNQIIVSV